MNSSEMANVLSVLSSVSWTASLTSLIFLLFCRAGGQLCHESSRPHEITQPEADLTGKAVRRDATLLSARYTLPFILSF